MSDGSLSQDEIDALLSESGDDIPMGGDAFGAAPAGGTSALSATENSTFIDLINTTSANVGSALIAMLGKEVTLSNPRLEVISGGDLMKQLSADVVEIGMDYEAGCVGTHVYYLELDLAKQIAALALGENEAELTEMELGAISEAMNIASGSFNNTVGTKIKKDLRTAPATFAVKQNSAISLNGSDSYAKVVFDFTIEGCPPYKLVEVFAVNVVKDIAGAIAPAAAPAAPAQMVGQMPNTATPSMNVPNMGMQMQQPMMNQGMQMNQGAPASQYQSVQFSQFQGSVQDSGSGNINLLMDVDMELTVELGRTRKPIREILAMGEGTVIELDKLAGEPVDILVNGKLVARGEVVVIDESFGVRVTEIINPMDRLRDM